MAILFKDWLDMFINNGFNPENITHWPEEGSEPEEVEELPEDPEFGRVYHLCNQYSSGYYTIDAHDNWIDLSEGVQPGGIVEVSQLPETPEEGVIYHLYNEIIPEDENGYYTGIVNISSSEAVYIRVDDIWTHTTDGYSCVGDDVRIVALSNNAITATSSGADFVYKTADVDNQTIDYKAGSFTTEADVLDLIEASDSAFIAGSMQNPTVYYKDVASSNQLWSYFLDGVEGVLVSKEGGFEAVYDDLIIAQRYSSGEYTTDINDIDADFIWKGEDYGYPTWHSGNEDSTEYTITNMLTDIGSISSGQKLQRIYYPSYDGIFNYNYDAFVALTCTDVTEDSQGHCSVQTPIWTSTTLEKDKFYDFITSSGRYYINGHDKDSYGIRELLTNSGNITDIFYGTVDSYGHYAYYTQPYEPNHCGYWFEPDFYNGNGYIPHVVWPGYSLDTNIACKFLNYAYSGNEYGNDYMNKAFFPLHDSNSYSATYEAVTIPDIHTPMIFLTGDDDDEKYSGAMATNKVYYRYTSQYGGDDVRVGEATLPAAGSSTTITIDGVTYTISRAA